MFIRLTGEFYLPPCNDLAIPASCPLHMMGWSDVKQEVGRIYLGWMSLKVSTSLKITGKDKWSSVIEFCF